MKRSEEAKIIADIIGHYDTSSAYAILDAIEAMDMLPPERVRFIDKPPGNTLVSHECSWEPEDGNEEE